ncbi:hypothetical protein B0H10DRAFT_1969824 [Mycena sp. CBHHK59/15]|nr:hypothetical protein B0H10DRAFT_1969824 [Mycena sp. CBHHK59/15]
MLRYSYILRLGYRVEGPEQSDHSDAPDLSDDDSFMNLDSPIPSPKAPQDYDSELELPTVEWRSPSPLEYIPDSDLPSTQIGPLLQSVPETEDLADHDEQENGSSAPATMPDAVSSAPTSSESAPPGITVTPNLGAEPTARRSGRKRKEREELKDLSAALSACICGSSAAPLDSSEHPNVGCKFDASKLSRSHIPTIHTSCSTSGKRRRGQSTTIPMARTLHNENLPPSMPGPSKKARTDRGAQSGAPRQKRRSEAEKMHVILDTIQAQGWSLGQFMYNIWLCAGGAMPSARGLATASHTPVTSFGEAWLGSRRLAVGDRVKIEGVGSRHPYFVLLATFTEKKIGRELLADKTFHFF